MGPLFSLALMSVFGGILFIIIFVPSVFFLTVRRAFAFAAIEVVAIGFGFFVGMLIQTPYLGEQMNSNNEVFNFFAVSLMTACFAAIVAAVLFRKLMKSRV